jgi:phosphatidylglycerophosphatase A
MRNFLVKTLSTFFYIGFLPLIPGTFASLIGIAIFYLIRGNFWLMTLLAASIIILGFAVSGEAERMFNKKDAKYIVIDEVAGMLLSLMFLPFNIKFVFIAFVLFRLLDILKPYPANRIQELKGSIGIMGDDIVAGLYTNLIISVALKMGFF